MRDDTIPWPTEGDRLFRSAADWWHSACLNWSHDEWDLYAQGYKLAADVLVQHVVAEQTDQDALVYPIAFLYRQYLELSLKELIRLGSQLLGTPDDLPHHHDLRELWRECRRIMEQVWPRGPSDDLDAVEERINEFTSTDPASTGFRYPTDKSGSASLPELRHVNLRNLSDVMAGVHSLLDGAITGISEYLDAKREMEEDLRT